MSPKYRVPDPIVDTDTGCHIWQGSVDRLGYGAVHRGGRHLKAHQWYWLQKHGSLPEKLELDHLCENRRCCNPDHLEPVTHRENVMRGNSPHVIASRNNKCMKGHDFTPENTYYQKDGSRLCRTCRRNRWREWNRARKGVDSGQV